MKKFLLLLLMLWIPSVHGKTPPEKFQNPIFNDVLWSSNYNFAHDIKITPTYIDELNYDYDSTCEYLTEDEKGILLKCKEINTTSQLDPVYYNMYYIRDKWHKTCSVWFCPFKIDDGKIHSLGMGAPAALSSEVFNCEDEEEEVHDPSIPYEPMNCIEELKARGWDKYLPGSLPDEK